MQITCPSCSANYNVDASRVPGSGMTMRCPKCSHSFQVSADGSTSSGAADGNTTMLDGAGRTTKSERYFVKRPTGKVFGPFDAAAVEMMLKADKLGPEAQVSVDKSKWSPIASIPDFARHIDFSDSDLPSFEGMDPKATMMGGWTQRKASDAGTPSLPGVKGDSLPQSKTAGPGLPVSARPELPKPKSAGSPSLPVSKRKTSGPPDLPQSKTAGPGLPVSKSSAELPAPRGRGPELPAPRGRGADLPAPKSSSAPELPASKSHSDLPASSRSPGLPTPKSSTDHDLPASAQSELPASAEADLPAPSASGTEDDPIGLGAELSNPFGGPAQQQDDDDDLFAAPGVEEDDLFGAPDDDEDLFGDPPGGPGMASDDDDLFGSPAGGPGMASDDDDLFGSPTGGPGMAPDDDLFGAPQQESKGDIPDDELFGASDGDDLFERDVAADDDDFLSGDGGFSFLDDAPPPEGGDAFEDDLFGDEVQADDGAEDDWEAELLKQSQGRKKSAKDSEPVYDDQDPFRPMSPGIREPDPEEAAPAATASEEDVRKDDKKRGSMAMIAVPILVVLVAGVGWVIYDNFLSDATEVVEQPTEVARGPMAVDLAALTPDNHSDYQSLMDRAESSEVPQEQAPQFVVGQALMLSRYDDDAIRADFEKRAEAYKDASEGYPALARGAYEAIQGNADAARAYLEPLLGGSEEHVYFASLFMGIGDIRALEAEVESGDVVLEEDPEVPETDESAVGTDNEDDEAESEGADQTAEDDGEEGEQGEDGDQAVAEAEGEGEDETVGTIDDHPLVSRARRALTSASDARSDAPLPQYWLGRIAELTNDKKRAITDYTRAIDRFENHVASRLRLGHVLYEENSLNEAIENLEVITGELSATASSNERASALHWAGQVYVARRQSEMAIKAFTNALSIDPSRNDTLRALAHEYETAKKYEEALNFFTTNKNLGQEEPEVMLGIVRSHIGLEQWTAAIDQLEEAQKLFPDDARFPFYLGRLNRDRGDFLQAQKAFERAVEIDGKALRAHTALAKLAWRMDQDMRKGEEHVQVIVSEPERIDSEVALEVAEYYHMSERRTVAEQWYREALRLDPNYWPARLSLAKLLLEENKHEEAQALLEKARQEGVEDIRLAAYLADAYRQSGDFDRAIDEIGKVIEKYPKNEEYVFILGRIHFDRGNLETAREQFSKAYDLNPRFHDAYYYVGRTAYADGDHQTALKIFRHVLDYQPDRGDYRYYMARALEDAGRTSQALDEYRKATAVDPGFGIANPGVYIHRGRLLTRLGYPKEGRDDIARALEINPDMVEAQLAMGETNYQNKNYDAAIRNYTKALEQSAEHPRAQYELGMALIFASKQREGARRLQLAIKHGYEDPEVYRTLGYLYKELGQRRLALESFQEYLKETKGKNVPVSTRKELVRQIQELGG